MIKYTTANFSDRTINIVTGLLMALTFLAAPLATAGKDVDVHVLGYRTNAACLQFMVLLIPVRAPSCCLQSRQPHCISWLVLVARRAHLGWVAAQISVAFTLVRSISTAQFTKSGAPPFSCTATAVWPSPPYFPCTTGAQLSTATAVRRQCPRRSPARLSVWTWASAPAFESSRRWWGARCSPTAA